jgi:hypothetical protein
MPRAPLRAQIIIGLLAVLVIAYGWSVIRLDGDSGGYRTAVPGQLIAIRIDRPMDSVTSTDTRVVAPVSVSVSPLTRAYFLALTPGRATLRALSPCSECRFRLILWSVEIRVWPSG